MNAGLQIVEEEGIGLHRTYLAIVEIDGVTLRVVASCYIAMTNCPRQPRLYLRGVQLGRPYEKVVDHQHPPRLGNILNGYIDISTFVFREVILDCTPCAPLYRLVVALRQRDEIALGGSGRRNPHLETLDRCIGSLGLETHDVIHSHMYLGRDGPVVIGGTAGRADKTHVLLAAVRPQLRCVEPPRDGIDVAAVGGYRDIGFVGSHNRGILLQPTVGITALHEYGGRLLVLVDTGPRRKVESK